MKIILKIEKLSTLHSNRFQRSNPIGYAPSVRKHLGSGAANVYMKKDIKNQVDIYLSTIYIYFLLQD